jgi:hypothetical protein
MAAPFGQPVFNGLGEVFSLNHPRYLEVADLMTWSEDGASQLVS